MFARGRLRLGLPLSVVAGAGLLVAAYLTWTKLSGGTGVCVIGGGCDRVEASSYSVVLGIPVAAFGAAWSALALIAAIGWWRTGDRRALLLLYVGGLIGVMVEAYLVYLELFVIHAICSWCVFYG